MLMTSSVPHWASLHSHVYPEAEGYPAHSVPWQVVQVAPPAAAMVVHWSSSNIPLVMVTSILALAMAH